MRASADLPHRRRAASRGEFPGGASKAEAIWPWVAWHVSHAGPAACVSSVPALWGQEAPSQRQQLLSNPISKHQLLSAATIRPTKGHNPVQAWPFLNPPGHPSFWGSPSFAPQTSSLTQFGKQQVEMKPWVHQEQLHYVPKEESYHVPGCVCSGPSCRAPLCWAKTAWIHWESWSFPAKGAPYAWGVGQQTQPNPYCCSICDTFPWLQQEPSLGALEQNMWHMRRT